MRIMFDRIFYFVLEEKKKKMFSSTSIEQQHQEFKRQMSAHDTYPCFLLDQTLQQRISSPSSTIMPSFLSAQAMSPLAKSPMPINTTTTTTSQTRTSIKQSNPYRLFPTSPSNTSTTTATRNNPLNTRSTTPIADAPIEKTIVPLRTLTDLFPSFSYSQMKSKREKVFLSTPTPIHPLTTTPNTISIFGFREEDLEYLLQQFQDIGTIDNVERPIGCEKGNFLNITYSNNVSYQNALNRDGMLFNGYMIGVVPLISK